MNLYSFKCAITISFLITSVVLVTAQSHELYTPKGIIEEAYCESNLSTLGILNQTAPRNSLILIISYSGTNENSSAGSRRLFNAKTMFTSGFDAEFNRKAETIIVAEGSSVTGKGYLDFFVAGELETRIFFKPNGDLILGPCAINYPYEKPCDGDFARLFFPCKKK